MKYDRFGQPCKTYYTLLPKDGSKAPGFMSESYDRSRDAKDVARMNAERYGTPFMVCAHKWIGGQWVESVKEVK